MTREALEAHSSSCSQYRDKTVVVGAKVHPSCPLYLVIDGSCDFYCPNHDFSDGIESQYQCIQCQRGFCEKCFNEEQATAIEFDQVHSLAHPCVLRKMLTLKNDASFNQCFYSYGSQVGCPD